MPYRKQYIAISSPAWPPNASRMKAIYEPIAWRFRNSNLGLTEHLLTVIQSELIRFDANYFAILSTQSTFNDWLSSAAERIMSIPFSWTDSRGCTHEILPFGATQMLLNRSIKDWWALSLNGTNPATFVDRLHGTLDQNTYTLTSRYCIPLPSLQEPNGIERCYFYNLTHADYMAYQGQLDTIGARLSSGLHLPDRPIRIEIEQLLWGWI